MSVPELFRAALVMFGAGLTMSVVLFLVALWVWRPGK